MTAITDPARADPGSLMQLPCGCVIWTVTTSGRKGCLMRPCSTLCPAYRYVTRQMLRRRMPTMTVTERR